MKHSCLWSLLLLAFPKFSSFLKLPSFPNFPRFPKFPNERITPKGYYCLKIGTLGQKRHDPVG